MVMVMLVIAGLQLGLACALGTTLFCTVPKFSDPNAQAPMLCIEFGSGHP